MSTYLTRLGAPASAAAGCLWLLVWLHQLATHGPTATNEMRIVLGLTWLDSAKFLVVPLMLLFPGILGLYRQRGRPGILGRIGFIGTVVGLSFLILGAAAEFWAFPWGSYAVGFEAPQPRVGGVIQALTSLVFTLGLILFSVDLVRAKVLPIWAAPVVVLGGLTTFYLTPVSWFPGLAWLLLGSVLVSSWGGARARPKPVA